MLKNVRNVTIHVNSCKSKSSKSRFYQIIFLGFPMAAQESTKVAWAWQRLGEGSQEYCVNTLTENFFQEQKEPTQIWT